MWKVTEREGSLSGKKDKISKQNLSLSPQELRVVCSVWWVPPQLDFQLLTKSTEMTTLEECESHVSCSLLELKSHQV